VLVSTQVVTVKDRAVLKTTVNAMRQRFHAQPTADALVAKMFRRSLRTRV